jgi:hypothetical protein
LCLRGVAEYHSDSAGMNWRYKMYCYLWEVNCICGSLYDGYKKDSGMWIQEGFRHVGCCANIDIATPLMLVTNYLCFQ